MVVLSLPSFSPSSVKDELYMSGFYVQDIPVIREKAENLGMKFIHYREKNNWAAVKFIML